MYFSEKSGSLQAFGIILVFEAFLQGKRNYLEACRARSRAVGALEAGDAVLAEVKASWEFQELCQLSKELLPPDLLRELQWEARWV